MTQKDYQYATSNIHRKTVSSTFPDVQTEEKEDFLVNSVTGFVDVKKKNEV
jgi:hypothetical protein